MLCFPSLASCFCRCVTQCIALRNEAIQVGTTLCRHTETDNRIASHRIATDSPLSSPFLR